MKYDTSVNEVQALIMRQLFMKDALRFSEINEDDFPSDQFSYHLRQLSKNGLIEKTADNRYQLSITGRSRAILMDAHSNKFIEQGFVACRIVLTRQHAGVTQYLVQQRTKVPYRGYISEPGGKILFGEDVIVAGVRNMKAETGLTCDLVVKGLAHFKDNYQAQIVQDKFFFILAASNPVGEILVHGATGDNVWLSMEEIQHHPKAHQGLTDLITVAEGDSFGFIESTHFVDEY